MVLGGALTLGAIVMLGGATGARAGDLTGLFDAMQSAAPLSVMGSILSHSSESAERSDFESTSLYVIERGELEPTMTLQTWSS
jgi:hypothetical protein